MPLAECSRNWTTPIHQQFTVAELRTIVEVAGLAERAVAAHCHGKPGIMAALEAGVLTIEHGTYVNDECCAAMRETGAILVPTRTIIEDMLATDIAPDYARAKLRAVADLHAEAVTRAYKAGVTIAMGTDIALTGMDLPNSWGHNGSELAHLVTLGMTPLQAIEAATATAPATLGRQAPRSGVLAVGYDADVISLDADPLTDISVLAQPAHVTGVWTAGRQVKGAVPEVTSPRARARLAAGWRGPMGGGTAVKHLVGWGSRRRPPRTPGRPAGRSRRRSGGPRSSGPPAARPPARPGPRWPGGR